MELIIQEILEKITSHCEKGLEELIMKKRIYPVLLWIQRKCWMRSGK